jgi:large subunit ribosomal protein L24
MLIRIKKGDTVICLGGKDRDKKGKVLRVTEGGSFIVVEKMNIKKRARKASRQFQGGIIEMLAPIPSSKLMLICPRCGKPSRVRSKALESGKRVRSCGRCEDIIDKV